MYASKLGSFDELISQTFEGPTFEIESDKFEFEKSADDQDFGHLSDTDFSFGENADDITLNLAAAAARAAGATPSRMLRRRHAPKRGAVSPDVGSGESGYDSPRRDDDASKGRRQLRRGRERAADKRPAAPARAAQLSAQRRREMHSDYLMRKAVDEPEYAPHDERPRKRARASNADAARFRAANADAATHPRRHAVDETSGVAEKALVRAFLDYRTSGVSDRSLWRGVLASGFELVLPREPYRVAYGVAAARNKHTLSGVDEVVHDTRSMLALIEMIRARCWRLRQQLELQQQYLLQQAALEGAEPSAESSFHRKIAGVGLCYRTPPDLMLVDAPARLLLCAWSFTTVGLVSLGLPAEVVVDGMLRATFVSENGTKRLKHVELNFDSMAYMQQLNAFGLLDLAAIAGAAALAAQKQPTAPSTEKADRKAVDTPQLPQPAPQQPSTPQQPPQQPIQQQPSSQQQPPQQPPQPAQPPAAAADVQDEAARRTTPSAAAQTAQQAQFAAAVAQMTPQQRTLMMQQMLIANMMRQQAAAQAAAAQPPGVVSPPGSPPSPPSPASPLKAPPHLAQHLALQQLQQQQAKLQQAQLQSAQLQHLQHHAAAQAQHLRQLRPQAVAPATPTPAESAPRVTPTRPPQLQQLMAQMPQLTPQLLFSLQAQAAQRQLQASGAKVATPAVYMQQMMASCMASVMLQQQRQPQSPPPPPDPEPAG